MSPDRRLGHAAPFLAPRDVLLRKLERFENLGAGDRTRLAQLAESAVVVPARTDLFREGDTPGGPFVILEGMACRFKLRSCGARQITAYMIPGDFCDLDLLLRPRMDHALATLSACRVVRLTPEAIDGLTAAFGSIARAMRRATLVDDATVREWLVNIGSRSAIQRIAHLFCELLTRFRAVGLAHGDSYELPVSQLDLADTTGLSTVHVNRTLQELKRQGLIELRSRSLMIRDLPGLQSLGEFDPRYLSL